MSPEMVTVIQMGVVIAVAILLIRGLFSVGKKLISTVLAMAVTVYLVIQYGVPIFELLFGI